MKKFLKIEAKIERSVYLEIGKDISTEKAEELLNNKDNIVGIYHDEFETLEEVIGSGVNCDTLRFLDVETFIQRVY